MKLISLFIMLALVITVGGVWATWNYASGEANITALSTVTKNNITHGAQSSTNVGTISIAENSDSVLAVTVDEMEGRDTNGNGTIEADERFDKNGDGVPDSVENYIPEVSTSGKIVVTFTPDGSAPVEYKDGVSLTCTLTAAEGSAFKFANTTLTLNANSEATYGIAYTHDPATGVCTWTIEGEDLDIGLVDLYNDKPITTYAEYTVFVAAVAKKLEVNFALVVGS